MVQRPTQDAVADLEQARCLDPSGAPVYRVFHVLTLTAGGGRAEAKAHVMAIARTSLGSRRSAPCYGWLWRATRRRSGPPSPRLTAWLRADPQFSWHLAELFALLGDADAAIDWLGNAVDRGFVNYPLFATVDPLLAPLRSHPRFQALMDRTRVGWEAVVAETAE